MCAAIFPYDVLPTHMDWFIVLHCAYLFAWRVYVSANLLFLANFRTTANERRDNEMLQNDFIIQKHLVVLHGNLQNAILKLNNTLEHLTNPQYFQTMALSIHLSVNFNKFDPYCFPWLKSSYFIIIITNFTTMFLPIAIRFKQNI